MPSLALLPISSLSPPLCVCRLVGTPLAAVMGVKEKVRLTVSHNPTLESFYCNTTKNPSQSSIDSLCKQTGCSGRQVQRWFRRRRNQDRPSLLKKFKEARYTHRHAYTHPHTHMHTHTRTHTCMNTGTKQDNNTTASQTAAQCKSLTNTPPCTDTHTC
uniref:Homeobox domain-containing protein n=1 Tax=Hucho hucho TaxID=62062 RepID=A0A4W5Q1D1_9TELE